MTSSSNGTKVEKIVIPDAAIREFNEKYGKYLPKPQETIPYVDEDAMYLQYVMGVTND